MPPPIAATLVSKGAIAIVAEGFVVTGTKGPLGKNEDERAASRANNLLKIS